jgi:hypothetical protein
LIRAVRAAAAARLALPAWLAGFLLLALGFFFAAFALLLAEWREVGVALSVVCPATGDAIINMESTPARQRDARRKKIVGEAEALISSLYSDWAPERRP